MSQAPLYIVGGTGLFRRGLCSFLEDTPFRLAAEFDNAQACVGALSKAPEAEIIVYVSNGDPEASSAAVDALMSCADARVLVLSGELSVDELGACLRVGAGGYLLSNISKEVLTHSLRLILLGETVFPSQLATAWATGQLRQTGNGGDTSRALEVLTNRETEILGCLTEGSPNKMIARQLGITEATVKIHVKSLIRKIGVQNRTQAALWAIQVGHVKNPVDLAA
ncbi:MAG: DNA-binding response regulator [Alphaproteobacteria bacterium]|nr:DNA-binding response regulator [Alphaproteobacteria bacterium]